jgi:VanZ family protein
MTEAAKKTDPGPARGTPVPPLFKLRRCLLVVLVLLWVAAVIASHIPQEDLPELPTNGKNLHVLGFFGLASILALLLTTHGQKGWRRDLLVLLVMTAYAAFDEGTQPYFHRHGCLSDWLLDTASAAFALVVFEVTAFLLRRLLRRVEKARDVQRRIKAYLDPHDQVPFAK